MVTVHPVGSVLPGHSICPVCIAIARDGFGKPVDVVAAAAAEAMPDMPEPWACPRCSLVQVQIQL